MDFQAHLENTIRLIKEEPVIILSWGLLVQLIVPLSLGILSGPFIGAYLQMMVRYFRDGRKPQFEDGFAGMSRFGELFPFLFLSLLIFLGFVLFFIPGVLFTVWWMYALLLMVDRRRSLLEAMKESRTRVAAKGFFLHLVFLFMISIVPAFVVSVAAAVIPPLAVLNILLFPLQCACITSLYLEQFDTDTSQVSASRPAKI